MQENTLSQWGCQDRYQAHFIVRKETSANVYDFAARTILSTTGHFNAKKISSVKWNGGKIAQILNEDTALNEMIAKQSLKDANISIEPSDNGIRIHSKWKNSHEFIITKDLFEIYDKIAGHVKSL